MSQALLESLSFAARAALLSGSVAEAPGRVLGEVFQKGLIDQRGAWTPLGETLRARLQGRRARRAKTPRTPGAAVVPLEAAEQQAILRLLASLGAEVWVLGTHRPRGRKCPKCGTFVPEHQGTCQTPGIADLVGFLKRNGHRDLLFIECKRQTGGRLRPAQRRFAAMCIAAKVHHVVGNLDAVIAWLIDHAYLRRDQVAHYRTAAEARA